MLPFLLLGRMKSSNPWCEPPQRIFKRKFLQYELTCYNDFSLNPEVPMNSNYLPADFTSQSILNWGKYEAEAKALSDHSLEHVIKDCFEAAKSLKGVEGSGACKGEGFYRDLYFVHCDERKRRMTKLFGVRSDFYQVWKTHLEATA